MDFDVVIIGLGSAGAAAAAACAQEGLRVYGLDRRSLNETGAQWVNGVPLRAYTDAGFAPPREPELRHRGGAFHLFAGWGPTHMSVATPDFAEIDMRALQRRLQSEALHSGARLEGERQIEELNLEEERVEIRVSGQTIRARTLIDASGMTGEAFAPRTPVHPTEVCAAAQQVRAVRDLEAARNHFHQLGVPPGETVCFTGVDGGFSVVNIRLEEETSSENGPTLAILTGTIPARGHRSGTQLIQAFVEQHPWVGQKQFGGARPIPLAPPAFRLDHGPTLVIGDAARQIYGAHGSGVTAQLQAARLYARRLAAGDSPWEVNVAWQRTFGGELASACAFARMSTDVGVDDLQRMMSSGLMAPSATRATLDQRAPRPSANEIPRMALGAIRHPLLLARMLPTLNKMSRLRQHASRYPADIKQLREWTKTRNTLVYGSDEHGS